MNFKHWIGVAIVAFATVALSNRVAVLRKGIGT
jgi:hypothetical protein